MAAVLIQLLITLAVVGLIYWVILQLVPLPDPIGRVIHVVFVVLVALICLYAIVPLIGRIPHLG